MAGLGPRLAAATRAAMAADPSFENGAPLVLRGRFLAQAPWPYGDSATALELLERAFDIGPAMMRRLPAPKPVTTDTERVLALRCRLPRQVRNLAISSP